MQDLSNLEYFYRVSLGAENINDSNENLDSKNEDQC
jgi:hypothetical protein